METVQKFNFSTLPYDLKVGVLDCFDWKTRLKLLQVNKESRQLVLHQGPFGKRIQKSELVIESRGNCSRFIIDDYWIDVQAEWLNYLPLLDKVRVIHSLDVDSGIPLDSLAAVARLFPRIKAVRWLSLHGVDIVRLKAFFDNVNNWRVADFSLSIEGDMDIAYLAGLFEKHFQNTKRISFYMEDHPGVYWKALAKTNAQFINLGYIRDAYGLVESLIRRGAPNNYPTVCCNFKFFKKDNPAALEQMIALHEIKSTEDKDKVLKLIVESDPEFEHLGSSHPAMIRCFRKNFSPVIDGYFVVIDNSVGYGVTIYVYLKQLPVNFLA